MDSTTTRSLLGVLPIEACEEAKPSRQASKPMASATTSLYPTITTDSLNCLKTSIHSDRFPDDLLVHGNVASESQTTIRYSRVYPVFPRDSTGFPNGKRGRMRKHFAAAAPSRNVAQLHLASSVWLASGPQATVLRTPLSLPSRSGHSTLVSVMVKVAQPTCGAHQRLMVEAELFNAISPLREENSPQSDYENVEIGGGFVDIPKFYGFYLPVRKDGSMLFRSHGEGCNEECQQEVPWMTPILLLEESEETAVVD